MTKSVLPRPDLPPTDPATRQAAARVAAQVLHRSGAVARMLRMPVATLRVWERRYALTQPELSPSGQRLYSAADVRRLALLKQLSDLGHAIGSLAALDMAQLQQVAATHAQVLAAAQGQGRATEPARRPTAAASAAASPPAVLHPAPLSASTASPAFAATAPGPRTFRVAVVGPALGRRLRRPALQRRLGPTVEVLGPFDDLAQASAALRRDDIDALLLHAPQLQTGWLADIEAAAPTLADAPKAVFYGYAPEAVCEAVAHAGAALLREPQPDAVLGQWLHALAATSAARTTQGATPAGAPLGTLPPRRWDPAALADFAGLSSTIACECPRHVAELLVQLSHFEAYSAQCENRSPTDAELHAYLRRVTAVARASFEDALEHVARHEGLTLPEAIPAAETPRRTTGA